MKTKPLISACIITYNHEKYIKSCIEGALSQNIDGPYEIIIGDDCSTDGTAEVCQFYNNRYPKLITFIKREKNLGIIGNWVSTIKECRGSYIALCEGDDFWTDSNKLQKQVNFLEKNRKISLHIHSANIVNESNQSVGQILKPCDGDREFTGREMISLGTPFAASSLCFRNNVVQHIPSWFHNLRGGHTVFSLLSTLYGNVFFRDEIMSVWRNTSINGFTSNIWNNKKERRKVLENLIYLYTQFNELSKSIYKNTIDKRIEKISRDILETHNLLEILSDSKLYRIFKNANNMFKIKLIIKKLLLK